MKQALTTDSRSVPSELDSAQAKLVYLYLDTTNGATAVDISDALAMKTMSTLSILNSLSNDDLVEGDGETYVTAN